LTGQFGIYAPIQNAVDDRMRDLSMDTERATRSQQPRFTNAEKVKIHACPIFDIDRERDTYDLNAASIYIVGIGCCFRGSDEHVTAKLSNFREKVDEDGFVFVEYTFPPDKTTSGGLSKGLHWKPARMYQNLDEPRVCAVLHFRGELHSLYLPCAQHTKLRQQINTQINHTYRPGGR